MKKYQVENIVRDLRFQNDRMTQLALAGQAGVSRQTIHAIETAKYIPSLPLALKIARIFEKPVEEIFTLADASCLEPAMTEGKETTVKRKIRAMTNQFPCGNPKAEPI